MQRTMFDSPPKRTRSQSAQRENLERVSSGIGATVLLFVRSCGVGCKFHADELRKFVAARHPTAPASCDRILRNLKQRGLLAYTVENRRASLYRIDRVRAA